MIEKTREKNFKKEPVVNSIEKVSQKSTKKNLLDLTTRRRNLFILNIAISVEQ